MKARNLVVDATVFVISALTMVVAAASGLDSGALSDERLLLSTAVTVPALVLIWWRRRWPVQVALLLLIPAALTDFVGGAAIIAVFTVTVHRPFRVALGVAVAHLLVPVPLMLRYPDPDLQVVGNATAMALVTCIVLAWGSTVRARRELIASLRDRAVRAETEAEQRADLLRGLERERIAREMHDVLAHRISLISLHAGALEIRRDLSQEQVAEAGGTIRASARQAMEELREILGVLRSSDADELRPRQDLADLDELIEEVRRAGTPVDLDNRLTAGGDTGPETLPAAVNRTAFRLVQEGLTNARKHAPGATVAVRLDRTSQGELHVLLRNPLPAVPVRPALPGSRSGLVGLAERVTLAGGRLEHGPRRTVPSLRYTTAPQSDPAPQSGAAQESGAAQQSDPAPQSGAAQQYGGARQSGLVQQLGEAEQVGGAQQSAAAERVSGAQKVGAAEQSSAGPQVSGGPGHAGAGDGGEVGFHLEAWLPWRG
ncbi:histidine kinase [Dactylosporangium sp. NPDC000521]|uniref:sensor histidine kinase n=1 Tax=Dactylosporangium sp. NPDC000521 TaxID=3363975 RepID=UPI0036B6C36E